MVRSRGSGTYHLTLTKLRVRSITDIKHSLEPSRLHQVNEQPSAENNRQPKNPAPNPSSAGFHWSDLEQPCARFKPIAQLSNGIHLNASNFSHVLNYRIIRSNLLIDIRGTKALVECFISCKLTPQEATNYPHGSLRRFLEDFRMRWRARSR